MKVGNNMGCLSGLKGLLWSWWLERLDNGDGDDKIDDVKHGSDGD